MRLKKLLLTAAVLPALFLQACGGSKSDGAHELMADLPPAAIPTVDFQSPLLAPIPIATSIAKYEARNADVDAFGHGDGLHAIKLFNIGDFEFVGQGELIEYSDGKARLTGLMALRNQPNRQFKVDMRFSGRNTAQTAKRELKPGAYKENGGPVDTATYKYYKLDAGILEGAGDLAGMYVKLKQRGPQFQIGNGASGKNIRFGGSTWFSYELVGKPKVSVNWPKTGDGDVNVDLDQFYCVELAEASSVGSNGGHAFWAPNIGEDFVFTEPGKFVEYADGTARLTGKLTRLSSHNEKLFVDITFAGRRENPTADEVQNEFNPGSVLDLSKIHIYETSTGVIVGGGALLGLKATVVRRGPGFMVGMGGNNKNLLFGASGWFTYTVVTQPSAPRMYIEPTGQADFNVNLSTCNFLCVEDAKADPRFGSGGGHGLFLPGLAGEGKSKFIFVDYGRFVEYGDGTAVLTGTVRDFDDEGKRFSVRILFSERTDVPPPGSPKKELAAGAYSLVDVTRWHYYKKFQGTLIGQDKYLGAVVKLDPTEPQSPVMQVGFGANNKNLNYGLSGWFHFHTESMPIDPAMKFYFDCNDGDINVDLPVCTEICIPDPITGIPSAIE